MRGAIAILVLGTLALTAAAQQVVDRIMARVEDDIITLSEMRELARFQRLLSGRSASDAELLDQLIEQWIVATEAVAARFPRPTETQVRGEIEQLEKQFGSSEAYRARLEEAGLSPSAARRLLERRLYLARYLDYKFRPAAQVEAQQIERYYRERLAPQLAERGQQAPPLDAVREQIRELLTEREINARASEWLTEAKSRLRIEKLEAGR